MEDKTLDRLKSFKDEHNANTKGPLALLIQVTRSASSRPLPLDPDDFLTKSKGQVAELSGSRLRSILKEHGITQTLAAPVHQHQRAQPVRRCGKKRETGRHHREVQ